MKKCLIILAFACAQTFVMAEIQSPIYTDDIGRSHFLGKGGYSTIKQTQMESATYNAVNDAMNQMTEIEQKTQETKNNIETDITNVIKERPEIQRTSHKSTFSSEQRKMDATAPYGYGMTNIPAGVNDSKTIYRDDLGRLHFFGKANQIKE